MYYRRTRREMFYPTGKTGVRRGSVLSPVLFGVYVNSLIDALIALDWVVM